MIKSSSNEFGTFSVMFVEVSLTLIFVPPTIFLNSFTPSFFPEKTEAPTTPTF